MGVQPQRSLICKPVRRRNRHVKVAYKNRILFTYSAPMVRPMLILVLIARSKA